MAQTCKVCEAKQNPVMHYVRPEVTEPSVWQLAYTKVKPLALLPGKEVKLSREFLCHGKE